MNPDLWHQNPCLLTLCHAASRLFWDRRDRGIPGFSMKINVCCKDIWGSGSAGKWLRSPLFPHPLAASLASCLVFLALSTREIRGPNPTKICHFMGLQVHSVRFIYKAGTFPAIVAFQRMSWKPRCHNKSYYFLSTLYTTLDPHQTPTKSLQLLPFYRF